MKSLPRALAGALLAALLCAAPALARDDAVTSFDGTQITVHFFPSAGGGVAPTVLLGPGWGSPGATDSESADDPSTGTNGVRALRDAGYNVLTWDPRGFGTSGGTIEVDSPDFEGRDVQALIDYVAVQAEAQLDAPGDPRVGMAGGSYGGGIQLVAAALDPRIDAIAPVIAWHSLRTSLDKAGAAKTGWSNLLYAVSANRNLDQHVTDAHADVTAGRPVSAADASWFTSRGPGALVSKIKAPTLLIQGTVDTLFTLQEAIENYGILRHDGVPVKMLWFCGGHGICLTNPGDQSLASKATLAWFDQYLKGGAADTDPGFRWVDQLGKEHSASSYPLTARTSLVARGFGTLKLLSTGGAGPVKPPAGAAPVGVAAAGITPAKATNAVNVRISTGKAGQLVVGAPRLTLAYKGRAKATHVLAQIVDNATGKVLGNQITPVRVKLDGRRHTVTVPLEVLAATTRARSSFTLQLVAQSTAYDLHPAGGHVIFDKIKVTLPVVSATR